MSCAVERGLLPVLQPRDVTLIFSLDLLFVADVKIICFLFFHVLGVARTFRDVDPILSGGQLVSSPLVFLAVLRLLPVSSAVPWSPPHSVVGNFSLMLSDQVKIFSNARQRRNNHNRLDFSQQPLQPSRL